MPKGNPDGLKQAFSVTYGRYPIGHLFHPGRGLRVHPRRLRHHSSQRGSESPRALDELRRLEQEGYIGSIHPEFFTTCGIGTNVESSKAIGQGIAADLRSAEVDYALTST